MGKTDLLNFLKSQRAMAIASQDGNELWIANVFMGIDDKFIIYFIISKNSKHSQQILQNPRVAFSTIWFNEKNHADRKGVQGIGTCEVAVNETDIATGIKLHNQNYPEFKERITVDWIHKNEWQSKVWVIKPTFIKFWNDELYGIDETEEFKF